MRAQFISALTVLSKPAVAIGGALLIGGGLLGYALLATRVAPNGVLAAASLGPLTEEVDVTGTVQAAHSTDLGFQIPGRVSYVFVSVGDHVSAGQSLLVLDSATQVAALELAKANVAAQQAKLDALMAGTRPEQLAINQTAVTQATNALASAMQSAYTTSDDAIHAKVDQIFTNARTGNAQLTVTVPDAALVNSVQAARNALESTLLSWQKSLAVNGASVPSLTTLSEQNLNIVSTFIDSITMALAETQPSGSLTNATLVGYQTTMNTARVNVSSARSALIAADTAYQSAVGALTLAQSGATQNDSNAQKAAVDAANAMLLGAQVAAAETVMTAPVSGTITAQNANLGQIVVPGAPLVSMISDGKYQVALQVSETDIGKIKLHDSVSVTFDAYPGVAFPATVTTVDPAATVVSGVSYYGVTVTFLENDSRLVSGLTANVHIVTATKTNALSVPSSAVIRDGNAEFVYVEVAGKPVRTAVTTGIVTSDGKTEILSGVHEGDRVLSYGAAAN